jgi:hypothetical protein
VLSSQISHSMARDRGSSARLRRLTAAVIGACGRCSATMVTGSPTCTKGAASCCTNTVILSRRRSAMSTRGSALTVAPVAAGISAPGSA